MCPGGDRREIEPDANSVTKYNRVASGFEIAPSSEQILDRPDAGMEIANFRTRGLIMVKFVKSFVMDESGASAAEYALILAVIGTAIVVGALALGAEIGDAMNDASVCIKTPTSANCS
jgi:pilus assembly protein Flp/PilA